MEWLKKLLRLWMSESGEDEDITGGSDVDPGDGDGDIEDGDADADSGKDGGKDRSRYIPRDRFDKVNSRAQKLDALVTSGVLVEQDGELRLNPEMIRQALKKDEAKSDGNINFRFAKDEVHENAWPIVEKINKFYDHHDKTVGQLAYLLQEVQSAFQAVNEYPEVIARDSEIKKAAMDIMKNDPEFQQIYRNNPKKFYWAVKRAAERQAQKANPPQKPKKKPSFVVGKGDVGGEKSKRMVDLTKMTKEELDKMEREEFDRMYAQKK